MNEGGVNDGRQIKLGARCASLITQCLFFRNIHHKNRIKLLKHKTKERRRIAGEDEDGGEKKEEKYTFFVQKSFLN